MKKPNSKFILFCLIDRTNSKFCFQFDFKIFAFIVTVVVVAFADDVPAPSDAKAADAPVDPVLTHLHGVRDHLKDLHAKLEHDHPLPKLGDLPSPPNPGELIKTLKSHLAPDQPAADAKL